MTRIVPGNSDETEGLESAVARRKELIPQWVHDKNEANAKQAEPMGIKGKIFVAVVLTLIGGAAAVAFFPSPAKQPTATAPVEQKPVTFPYVLELGEEAQLPASNANELLLLKRTPIAPGGGRRKLEEEEEDDDLELVVSRSYEGSVWESAPGIEPLEPVCANVTTEAGAVFSSCAVNLNSTAGFSYRITKEQLDPESNSAKTQYVRMAIQATFGPTRTEMNTYLTAHSGEFDAETWVQEQMALPVTSFRKRWRERSSRRSTSDEGITAPCEIGSRWHRYTFMYRDRNKVVVIYADKTPGKYSLYIDGVLRTEVDDWLGVPWSQTLADDAAYQDGSKKWTLCQIEEDVGGWMGVWAGTTCNGKDWRGATRALFVAYNPAISFTTVDASMTNVFTGTDVTLANVQTKLNGDVVVIKSLSAACDISKRVGSYAFMSVDGVYYRFDPRVKRSENTVSAPYVPPAASVSAYFNDNNAVCPSAVRTFVNAEGCKRGSSCAPLVFSDTPITLDEATLIKWYSLSGKHVHYWKGLFLTQYYEISPCVSVKARWQRIAAGCTVTALDATTAAELANRIRNSVDTSNPHVLDTDTVAPGTSCTESQAAGVSTVGAIIDVDGACFQHVHPSLYDVHDFTAFAQSHPGTVAAFRYNRRNPITRFAEEGRADLTYGHPSSMDNFKKAFQDWSQFRGTPGGIPIGRLGDVVSFKNLPSVLQTSPMADLVGAIAAKDTSSSAEACGSPNEVANIEELGSQYIAGDNPGFTLTAQYFELDRRLQYGKDKYGVFVTVAVKAQDQLRQRMGFALSQIFTIGEDGFGGFGHRYVSPYAHYHDIMNKHAFGNYRELLREVAYNPMMGQYLTFLGSKSKFSSGSFPDENFARELMQLFSIGLYEMRENGRYIIKNRRPVPTYTTLDITNFARAWTGFFKQKKRNTADENESDYLDPMYVDAKYRDDNPKTKLKRSGYIGDEYPICGDLPPQHFLKKGATYVYTGETSAEDVEASTYASRVRVDHLGRFKPTPATSTLHSKLCATSIAGGKCTFPSKVTLDENIACDGVECTTTTIFVVQIADPNDGNKTRYYTYEPVPCVRMALFEGGIQSKHPPHSKQCSDPTTPVAGPVCCKSTNAGAVQTRDDTMRKNMCQFWGEMMTQGQAQARCEEQGLQLCREVWTNDQSELSCSKDLAIWWKASETCELQVYVNEEGQVTVVDDRPNTNPNQDDKRFLKDNTNFFNVLWANSDGTTSDDRYPTVVENNCQISSSSNLNCIVDGAGCLCNIDVKISPVFLDMSRIPSVAEIRASLFIGAPLPSSFPDGTYHECISAICLNAPRGVKVHVKGANGTALVWNANTILEYPSPFPGAKPILLFNKVSTVFVGKNHSGLSGGYTFRNPPNFMPFVGEQTRSHLFNNFRLYHRSAALETEAVLDYLFQHNNTPAFVGLKIIQRLVTSNPSSRYLRVVADAFRTGTYPRSKMTFSGKRGDLAATLAAVLLDREARSAALAADPSYGKMREPLLKLIHVMRSMEYEANVDTSEIVLADMQDLIGQGPFGAPTVFGFFDVGYSPKGKISKRKLVSPEGELGTGPYIINFFNGMASLIDRGLTYCDYGFGDVQALLPYDFYQGRPSCSWNHRRRVGNARVDKVMTGKLAFVPSNTTAGTTPSPEEIIDELDLLLTGGRLSAHNKAVVLEKYNIAAGLLPRRNTTNSTIPEFNCQCYLDRYPIKAAEFLQPGESPAWEPRVYCKKAEDYFRSAGLASTPPEDASCSGHPYALKEALKVLMFAQEFHMTSLNRPNHKPKKATKAKIDKGRKYKAVVVIDMLGGADTFNMLVPHSNCGDGTDHFQEYSDARGGVYNADSDTGGDALDKASLHQISVSTATQPCDTFGIHSKMPVLKQLYDAGELSFLANTGTLIEPLSVPELRAKPRTKRVPPSLGDHRGSQANAQNVDCDNAAAQGVMGRMFRELSSKNDPFQADLFSVTGNMKIIEGSDTPYMLDQKSAAGVPRLLQYGRLKNEIANITSKRSNSIYAETQSDAIRTAIDQTEELGGLMSDVTLATSFGNHKVSRQFKQIAKVIKLRTKLKQERGGFVVGSTGWDTHGNFDDVVGPLFESINNGLDEFQQEMKAQGAWDDVIVLVISDFARTITSNGKGTDHGWGGNYFIAGGKVNGGKIFGKYPDALGQTPNSLINQGRGILIPTSPWDAVWAGIAEWMGVPANKMDTVLPNVANFPESTILRKAELFK